MADTLPHVDFYICLYVQSANGPRAEGKEDLYLIIVGGFVFTGLSLSLGLSFGLGVRFGLSLRFGLG
ncbi:MAG: hypothetical protein ABW185_18725 [Sedimenticola sp.]